MYFCDEMYLANSCMSINLSDEVKNNGPLIKDIEKVCNQMKHDYQLDLTKVKTEAKETLAKHLNQMQN